MHLFHIKNIASEIKLRLLLWSNYRKCIWSKLCQCASSRFPPELCVQNMSFFQGFYIYQVEEVQVEAAVMLWLEKQQAKDPSLLQSVCENQYTSNIHQHKEIPFTMQSWWMVGCCYHKIWLHFLVAGHAMCVPVHSMPKGLVFFKCHASFKEKKSW